MSVDAAPRSIHSLLGLPVRFHGSRLGRTAELEVDVDGRPHRVPAAGSSVSSPAATAA